MRCLYTLVLWLCFNSNLFAASPFGRYVGVLHHKNIPQDQLARLDFITDQEPNGSVNIRAVLVLYFGDFSSTEYTSYDYDHVSYNLLTGTLVFDGSERGLSFVVQKFGEGTLEATLKTVSGEVGTLSLKLGQEATPSRPLMQQISGEYRSICNGHGERLQVRALPFHPLTTNRSDPFTPFTIVAELGENGDSACPNSGTCVQNTFSDTDYHFYQGRIDFHSKRGGLTCAVDDTGLNCGACRYQKHVPALAGMNVKTYPTAIPNWQLGNPGNAQDSIAGTFTGFVHQEFRDVYQPMVLTIVSYRQPNASGNGDALILSVSSNIGFGSSAQPDESTSVKFDPRPLNILSPTPMFDRLDHNSDTILKLTRLESNVVEGVWFSRRFGRVGTFYLTLSGLVNPTDSNKLMEPLSGIYIGDQWRVDMDVGLSENAPTSADPFYPLTIHGRFGMPELTTMDAISGGTYDPFTGTFEITSNTMGTIIGTHDRTGIQIHRLKPLIFRPMSPYSPVTLRKVQP